MSPSVRLAAWALAIVVSVTIGWAYLGLLATTAEPEGGLSELAQGVQDELAAAGELDLLFVGSSLLGRGLDTELLAEGLGTDPERIHALWRSNKVAAHWYAMVSNHVFGAGHRPVTLVVCSTLKRQLNTQLGSDLREAELLALMGEHEPVINMRVYGREQSRGTWGLLKVRRQELRGRLLDGIRARTVAALFLDRGTLAPGQDRLEAAHELALSSMEALLEDPEARDQSLESRVIPIVEDMRDEAPEEEVSDDPLNSFIPDFIDLADKYGARIVFVDMPVSERAGNSSQRVEPQVRGQVVELLNARGAGFVDLHDLGLDTSHFRDFTHLNKKGSRAFTEALIGELLVLDILGEGDFAPAELPLEQILEPRLSRLGTPPALAVAKVEQGDGACALELSLASGTLLSERSLTSMGLGAASPVEVLDGATPVSRFGKAAEFKGDDCKGGSWFAGDAMRLTATRPFSLPKDAGRFTARLVADPVVETPRGGVHWLYPGTSLRWELQGQGGEEPVVIEAVFRLADPTAPGVPTLEVDGGAAVPFERSGAYVSIRQELPPVAGPRSIEVGVGPQGPYGAISHLRLSQGEAQAELVGEDLEEAWRASGEAIVRGGTYAMAFPETVPALTQPPEAPRKSADLGAVWEAPELAFLSAQSVQEKLLVAQSPVRVSEDGVPLPKPNTSCLKARKEGMGQYCHWDHRLFISAPDGTHPATNGRSYSLSLDPDRLFNGGFWLYPGDRVEGTIPPGRLTALPGPPESVSLLGQVLGDEGALSEARPLRIEFLRGKDETPVITLRVPLAAFLDGSEEVALPAAPGVEGPARWRMRLVHEDPRAFLWLRRVDIVRDYRSPLPTP